jgi:hypothetical protein
MEQIELVRDVLDKELVDEEGQLLGRVDGVLIALDDDGPPRVVGLAQGFVVLAARISPRLVGPFQRFRKRWSKRRTARLLVPWEQVVEVNLHHVQVALHAPETAAYDWEKWLARHVVARLPGGKPPDEQPVGREKGKETSE